MVPSVERARRSRIGQVQRRLVQRLNVWPLRVQLSVLAVTLIVIVIAVVSVGAARIGQDQARAHIGGEMADLSTELASELDANIEQRYREVGMVASLPVLADKWLGDPTALRLTLERLQASYVQYAWVGFATPDGVVRAATRGLLEGQDVSMRPWFGEGLRHPTVGDVHEAVLLDRLLERNVDGQPHRFVDVAFPVFDAGGHVIGVLGAHLSWTWVSQVRERLISRIRSGRGQMLTDGEVEVLSPHGAVLVGQHPGEIRFDPAQIARITRDRRGYFVEPQADTSYLTGFAIAGDTLDFAGLRWIVVARQPVSVAFAPVRSLLFAILAIGVAVAIVGMVIAALLADRIARPIRILAQEASRIGREPGRDRFKRAEGSQEVVLLSHALRSLIRRLGTVERQLETATGTSSLYAEQIEGLRRLARTDPMTGLLNRRGFLQETQKLLAVPVASPSVGVMIIDVDHFKRVNDRFGHTAGDEVLCRIAETLTATVRRGEYIARFGGEEFVVLIPDGDAEAVKSLAERIRGAIAAMVVPVGVVLLSVTVSIGGAVLEDRDHDIQDAIDRADAALYLAKSAGRNRVWFADDAMSMTP